MKSIMLFISILLIESISFSQSDDLNQIDSLEIDNRIEEQVEQSSTSDDDPNTDLIFKNKQKDEYKISFRNRLSWNLDRSVGYIQKSYKGSPYKMYHRIKSKIRRNISGGILTEKDPGELHYADFLSFNLAIADVGSINKIVFGDYVLKTGLGLVFGDLYGMTKGAEIVSPVLRESDVVRSYLSSGESGFFRGAAFEFSLGNFNITSFISSMKKSASIDSAGNVTSIYSSGYFRTVNEISKRNNLSEKMYGAHIKFNAWKGTVFGLTYSRNYYSNPVLLDDGKKELGRSNTAYSADWMVISSATTFFGECAVASSTLAGLGGIKISPYNSFSVITAYRNYPYKFVTLHGNPFGERGSDENGMYLGLTAKIYQRLRLSIYGDLFRFNDSNSSRFSEVGSDILSQIELGIDKSTLLTVRYRRKKSQDKLDVSDNYGFSKLINGEVHKQQIRFNIDHSISKNLRVKGRYEYRLLKHDYFKIESGTLVMSDVVYSVSSSFIVNSRTIYYKTGSFDSGIYEFERDLDGVMTQPILYGKGLRWYILLKYELVESIELSAKYSNNTRDDLKKIGTGADQLPDNIDERIGIQIEIRF
ncbi:MAG: hypothetical protein HZB59_12705 [Ignavibacteriales bacterium]|nr:hypothetical protein [Ignavibacteriales bacterium]